MIKWCFFMNKKIDLSVKILGLIFIIISLCSVFFAACSQRGLYLDGAVFFMNILDNYSSGNYTFFQDIYHPRFFVAALQQLPLILAAVVFHIKSKITLATIYSFAMFFFPLLFLWWNYELTKRTKQYAILFWSVFSMLVLVSNTTYLQFVKILLVFLANFYC